MQKRADEIKLASDLGHRPARIAIGDGFSNFTADMWKTFIMIFAILITWDFLDEIDKKILAYFVRACKILTGRELQKKELDEAFERMNGILGSYQNNKRNIEPKLLKIINENSFLKYFLSNCDDELLRTSLDFIKPQKSTGSLAALDDFTSDEYQDFIRLTLIEDESAIRTEPFPGMLMDPYKETALLTDILNLLVEYYENLYNNNFISISSMIDSTAQHEKSSYILARFVQDDRTVDTYPGQIQFFFKHTIYKRQSLVYSLALVRWYKPVQDHKIRYHFQVDKEDINSCNIELWSNEFYAMSRDSIIPIYNILGKFIKCKFCVEKRNLKEYMTEQCDIWKEKFIRTFLNSQNLVIKDLQG
ncbi:hypothetical protein RhiirA1_450083 [Rhizophagus irregularis]|uniref:Uncharacterized protein n=1 Tax=Rhizophagus irregularis TaxID=588596 RepID=A0A2N0SFS9_9GLOM|nr:hypothetical protein RhiirA1_450083 [Rhizophagus irregularis]